MKKGLVLATLAVASMGLNAQNERIEYYTDSKISDTRFSLQAFYAPSYASRRLALYEPVKNGEELFSLTDEGSQGILGQRYGIMAYYELNDYFHFGVGFNQEHGGFIAKGFAAFDQTAVALDTVYSGAAKTRYDALVVPFQLVFHTQMTDVWALQVIPSYDLHFVTKLTRQWVDHSTYPSAAVEGVMGTLYERGTTVENARGFNGTIGFALGNEILLSGDLALTLRGEFRLGMLPINKADVGLREVPYSLGALVGFRYYL